MQEQQQHLIMLLICQYSESNNVFIFFSSLKKKKRMRNQDHQVEDQAGSHPQLLEFQQLHQQSLQPQAQDQLGRGHHII